MILTKKRKKKANNARREQMAKMGDALEMIPLREEIWQEICFG